MAAQFDTGIFSVVGLSGEILAGAKLYWYQSGTSTPLATYADEGLTTPNTNPVLAAADGRFPAIWLQNAVYKMVLKSSVDVTLVTRDPVAGTDLSTSDGSSHVGFIQGGTGAVARTAQDKMRETEISITDYGALRDNATDASPAIADALAYTFSLVDPGAGAIAYVGGPEVQAPWGDFYCTQEIEIKKTVMRFVGQGAGYASDAPTKFSFATGVTGMAIEGYNTIGNTDQPYPGTPLEDFKGAPGSVLEHFRLQGYGTGATAYGFRFRATGTLQHFMISSFSSHGIYVSTGGTGPDAGNANGWRAMFGRIERCGGFGIKNMGGDSNNNLTIGVDCSLNALGGIYENSFLGSTHIGMLLETNGIIGVGPDNNQSTIGGTVNSGGRRYALRIGQEANTALDPATHPTTWADVGVHSGPNGAFPNWSAGGTYIVTGPIIAPSAASPVVFLGGYVESDQGPIQSAGSTMFLGTTILVPVIGTQATLNAFNGNLTSPCFYGRAVDSSGAVFSAFLSGDATNRRLFGMVGPTSSGYNFTDGNGNIYLQRDNIANDMIWTGASTALTLGRATPLVGAIGIGKLVLGDASGDISTNGRRLGNISSTADLAGLALARGDVFFYRSPSAAGKVGAVVTTAGTGGSTATVKDFGVIDA